MSNTERGILGSQGLYDSMAASHDPNRLHKQQGSGSSLRDAGALMGELVFRGGAEALRVGGQKTGNLMRQQVEVGKFLGEVAKGVAGEVVFSLATSRRRP